MSSVEKILWTLTILLFLGGFAYALYNTSRTGNQAQIDPLPEQESSLQPGWAQYVEAERFTIERPTDYQIRQDHSYDVGEEMTARGVAFIIPAAYATGTNLSSDSYLSVEQLSDMSTTSCIAEYFMTDIRGSTTTVTEDGVRYSFGEMADAAAGNRYEEQVYALTESKPCTAVRYFIHSTNIGNYDPGKVQEFDRDDLLAEFDEIRRTLELK